MKFCQFWNFVKILKFLKLVEILKFGWNFEIWSNFWNFEIWSKFWNLVKILKFGQNSEFLCLQILYLKIFHLKILNWICRQCVDCQVRNIDSDCLLLEKSTVTLASRLSTYWRPLLTNFDNYDHFHNFDNFKFFFLVSPKGPSISRQSTGEGHCQLF